MSQQSTAETTALKNEPLALAFREGYAIGHAGKPLRPEWEHTQAFRAMFDPRRGGGAAVRAGYEQIAGHAYRAYYEGALAGSRDRSRAADWTAAWDASEVKKEADRGPQVPRQDILTAAEARRMSMEPGAVGERTITKNPDRFEPDQWGNRESYLVPRAHLAPSIHQLEQLEYLLKSVQDLPPRDYEAFVLKYENGPSARQATKMIQDLTPHLAGDRFHALTLDGEIGAILDRQQPGTLHLYQNPETAVAFRDQAMIQLGRFGGEDPHNAIGRMLERTSKSDLESAGIDFGARIPMQSSPGKGADADVFRADGSFNEKLLNERMDALDLGPAERRLMLNMAREVEEEIRRHPLDEGRIYTNYDGPVGRERDTPLSADAQQLVDDASAYQRIANAEKALHSTVSEVSHLEDLGKRLSQATARTQAVDDSFGNHLRSAYVRGGDIQKAFHEMDLAGQKSVGQMLRQSPKLLDEVGGRLNDPQAALSAGRMADMLIDARGTLDKVRAEAIARPSVLAELGPKRNTDDLVEAVARATRVGEGRGQQLRGELQTLKSAPGAERLTPQRLQESLRRLPGLEQARVVRRVPALGNLEAKAARARPSPSLSR